MNKSNGDDTAEIILAECGWLHPSVMELLVFWTAEMFDVQQADWQALLDRSVSLCFDGPMALKLAN